MAKKSEGQAVREAFDGPQVEHDELIDQMEARMREEHARGSDASESAAKVNLFIEKTGLNTQAFSWGKTILKKLPKKDGQAKAMDVIRSLKTIIPMLESHVGGQGTVEMSLGEPEPKQAPAKTAAKPKTEKPKAKADAPAKGDPELAADAEDFDKQASATVTPISFGGASA